MNTRIEEINNKAYCAYCGKKLRDYDGILQTPEPPLICDCNRAKKELELYEELRDLYNTPLADSVIDMKVEMYKNELLGIRNSAIKIVQC